MIRKIVKYILIALLFYCLYVFLDMGIYLVNLALDGLDNDYLLLKNIFFGSAVILIGIAVGYSKKKPSSFILNKIKIIDIFTLFLTAFLYRIIIDPIFRFEEIQYGFSHSITQEYLNPVFDYNKLLILIYTVLLVPIFEETIFRGYLLNKLLKVDLTKFTAITISCILFGLIHYELKQIIITFFLGVFCSSAYLKKGLIGSVIFHSSYNFIWFILDIKRNEYWAIIEYFNFKIFYWLILVLSMIACWTLWKHISSNNS
ncbi:MAG: type II CAAX endopeptidase family protein [Bacteroidota bacterium]